MKIMVSACLLGENCKYDGGNNFRIYDGTFGGKIIEGRGIFARLLGENGFRVVDVEEL